MVVNYIRSLYQLIGFAPIFAHSQQKRKYMKWWNKSEQTVFFFCCSTHDYILKTSAFEQDGPSQSTQKHVLIVVLYNFI